LGLFIHARQGIIDSPYNKSKVSLDTCRHNSYSYLKLVELQPTLLKLEDWKMKLTQKETFRQLVDNQEIQMMNRYDTKAWKQASVEIERLHRHCKAEGFDKQTYDSYLQERNISRQKRSGIYGKSLVEIQRILANR
jgi:hypothetical protein